MHDSRVLGFSYRSVGIVHGEKQKTRLSTLAHVLATHCFSSFGFIWCSNLLTPNQFVDVS